MSPALYFPVEERPLRMRARMTPLGSDLGNGARDALFFQADDRREATLRAKTAPALRGSGRPLCARYRALDDDAHPAVLAWMRAKLARELPQFFDERGPRGADATVAGKGFDGLLRHVQEDAVVIRRREDGSDAATMLHVCFPSRWRPEMLLDASFREIHGPVPGFADSAASAARMLAAMIDRGPYLRFVWTLCGDDALDHHPDEGVHTPWPEAQRGFLRVERQVTVGFPRHGAALFLIRTYLYSFAELGAARRATIARAIERMPDPVRRYKGIAGHESHVRRLLERAAAAATRGDEGLR